MTKCRSGLSPNSSLTGAFIATRLRRAGKPRFPILHYGSGCREHGTRGCCKREQKGEPEKAVEQQPDVIHSSVEILLETPTPREEIPWRGNLLRALHDRETVSCPRPFHLPA